MNPSRILGCLIAGAIVATSASAEEWTFTSRLSQRFQADTDRDLGDSSGSTNNNGGGFVFESATRAEGAMSVATKRTQWTLASGIGASFFAGGGANDTFDHSYPTLSGSVQHTAKRSQFGLSADFSIQETSYSQFDDAGGGDQNTNEIRLDVEGNYAFQLSPRDTLELSASGSRVRFSDESTDLEPYDNVETEIAWSRRLNRRTTGSVALGAGAFWADDVNQTESIYGSLSAGIGRQVTKRLGVNVEAGAALVNSEDTVNGRRRQELGVGMSGEAEITYNFADVQTALRARQSLEPSAVGELQQRSQIEFVLGHDINSVSRFDFRTSYTYSQSASNLDNNNNDSSRQTFIVSPSYQLGLAPAWGMRVGYDYRVSDENSTIESSHGVFLELTRDFEIFP